MKIIFLFVSVYLAHMEIQFPPPRRSTFLKDRGEPDYDMTNPLGTNFGFHKPFPCKGYPPGKLGGTFKAGETINVKFATPADEKSKHKGGHCQFGISYDNGKTTAVLHTKLKNCFMDGLTFKVPIPADAPPSKNAVLVWGWLNNVGNREYYMNCADIEIRGGKPGGSISGPKLFVANLPGYGVMPENDPGDIFKAKIENQEIITIKADGSSSKCKGDKCIEASNDDSSSKNSISNKNKTPKEKLQKNDEQDSDKIKTFPYKSPRIAGGEFFNVLHYTNTENKWVKQTIWFNGKVPLRYIEVQNR